MRIEGNIFEILSAPPRCTGRGLRHISQLRTWCIDAGGAHCRSYQPDPIEYEYSPTLRRWSRYIGAAGDPAAEAEAERIEREQARFRKPNYRARKARPIKIPFAEKGKPVERRGRKTTGPPS